MPTNDEINGWLAANPTATDADRRAKMDEFGVPVSQLAEATGFNLADMQKRYDAAAPSFGSVGTNPGGLSSVWSGGDLSSGRADEVRARITSQYGDAFKGGVYDTSNDDRNRWVSGGLKAMGITADQGAKMLGVDPGVASRFFADNASGIDASAEQFQRDNPHLFLGKPGNTTAFPADTPSMPISPTQTATRWDVQPNQTVASQLETILKADSPLMQLARTRAQQRMNASGTMNSTMAGTAGEAAMIDAAMPIATKDASTWADAGKFNTGEANAFARDFNAFQRESEMANFNVGANDWASERDAGRQSRLNAENAERTNWLENEGAQRTNWLSAEDSARLTGRDNNSNANALARDAANNAFTLERDRVNNAFNLSTAGADEANARGRGYINALNQARSDYANALASISSSTQMDAGLKTETLTNLKTTYNTIIGNYAKLLGWDEASWLIADSTSAPAPTPTPSPADGAGGGGGSGWTPP